MGDESAVPPRSTCWRTRRFTLPAVMPVANGGALERDADQPKRGQSWPTGASGAAAADAASTTAALSAQPIQLAAEGRRIELTIAVLAEGREVRDPALDPWSGQPPV